MHASTKTLGQRAGVFREGSAVLSRLYGYVPFEWIYSDLCFRADGHDQFFQAPAPVPAPLCAKLAGRVVAQSRRPHSLSQGMVARDDLVGLEASSRDEAG